MHRSGGLDVLLFDALPQAALACDASGRIVHWNEVAQCRFGAVSAAVEALQQLGADAAERQALQHALDSALQQGRARCDGLRLLPPAAGADGAAHGEPTAVDVLFSRLPEQAAGGAPACVVLLVERAEHAESAESAAPGRAGTRDAALAALRADREAAVASSLAKSRFLSRMGHELRTPLNAVLGFTQLMRAEIEAADVSPEVQLAQLDFIEQSGWQLLTLIDNVLDLSRLESGRLELHPERLPLGSAVQEALSLVDAAARRRHLNVDCRIDGPLAEVCADRARLRQVLLVLLGNAVKFNVDHGQLTVTVRADADGGVVEVIDPGPGLDAAHRQALSASFDLADTSTAADASGVSLSIARRLVRAMGGSLAVHGSAGPGALFSLRLPLADRDAATGGVERA